MTNASAGADLKPEPWVEVTGSPHLFAWLAEERVSLAFTTYQTGKLFLLGRHPEGRLAVIEAAELPPTFGTDPRRVKAVIAGGRGAVFRAREGAELGKRIS